MGYLTFTPGAVFTAAQAQEIMDQTVIPVADATARDVAIPSPTQGMIVYNRSNDRLETFDGTIWQVWTKRYAALGPTSGLNVNNTASETQIVGEPLNGASLKAGAVVRLRIIGGISGVASASFTVRVKIAGSTVAALVGAVDSGVAVSNKEVITDSYFFFYSVGASGSVSGGLQMVTNAGNGSLSTGVVQADYNNLTSTTTVDTTAATVTFTATFQWGAANASNLFTRKGYVFERIV